MVVIDTKMTHSDIFFGLDNPDDFFFYIKSAVNRLVNQRTKRIEDLLFSIMGLNHLREWIAPGYNWNNKATLDSEQFFNKIYELEEFRIINNLCNHSKHLKKTSHSSEVKYGANISEYPLISEVKSIADGPPTQFEVDGIRIEIVLETVLNFYEDNWFNKSNL